MRSAGGGWIRRTGRSYRVSPPRHHHRGLGGARGTFRLPVRAGRCRHHHPRDRQAVGLRCLHRPGHHHWKIRAARSGPPHSRGACFHAPGGGSPGWRLPVPGVRPSGRVVRCPPRSTLGRRRTNLALHPCPSVPTASSVDPSAIRDGDAPRQTGVPSAGWLTSGRSSAAGHMWAMSCSTRSSTERNGSLHSTVRWAWSFSFRWTQSTV